MSKVYDWIKSKLIPSKLSDVKGRIINNGTVELKEIGIIGHGNVMHMLLCNILGRDHYGI